MVITHKDKTRMDPGLSYNFVLMTLTANQLTLKPNISSTAEKKQILTKTIQSNTAIITWYIIT